MKFLTEKRRGDYGRKGGQGGTQSTSNTPLNKKESRANMQDPNRSQRGGRPDTVRGRKTPVNIPSKSGDLITNFKVDANVPPEEQFQRLLDKATKDASGERVGRQATHPVDAADARKSGKEKTGGRVKGDRPVGAQKPRSRFVKGQGYTIPTKGKPATRIPGGTGTKTGSLSKGTLKFSGDAEYKRLQGTKGVSQADVSRKQQEFRTKYKEAQLKNKVKPQTKAKVKALLPSVGQTSAPAQPTSTKRPKNAASVQTSTVKAGGNLEFGKTKTGSFTYSGASSTNPAVSKAVKTSKVQVAPLKELPAGNTTVKVGDSTKRLDRIKSMKFRQVPAQTGRSATFKTADPTAASGSTFKSTTPQKVADLGKGTKVRSGQSATIRGNASSIKPPEVKPRLDSSKVQARARRMAMGRIGRSMRPQIGPIGLGLGAYDAWSELDAKSKDYISRGGTGKTTTKDKARAITRGVASALGYGVGVGAAAPIALAPVPGARPAAFAAGMYTGSKASDFAVKQADRAFDASYDTIAGATKWQKKEMEKINRQNQGAGVSAQQASFKKGDRAIIRDADGKERIGYAAKLTGKDGVTKTVYKHANDPKALRYTSSSPLERIGRALMPGRYAAKDEAARKKRVADFKKAALATEQYFTFLHITESMIAQGYDAEFIKEFWDWEDVKQVEFVNSLDLTEDIFIPDEEFLTESNDLSENFRKFIDRLFKRITKKKVPTPTQTSSGRPITSSGTGTKGNANVTSSGTPITGSSSVTPPKQTPKLADKVKTVLNNPKVRTAGLTAAGAGLVTLGGKLALDNNIIPGIPDTPDTKDSDADPKDPKDPKEADGPKGPVLTGPDGKPVQFPPLTPPPPVPKSREVLRPGHWRAINDPPQFHRDPALADYRNIRATKRR